MDLVLNDDSGGWQGHGLFGLTSHGTKLGQTPSSGGPSLLAPSLPQEQGLKANNSKELSMCFTEVSEGQSGGGGGAGEWARRGCFLGESLTLSPQSPLHEFLAHLYLGICLPRWAARGLGCLLG